MEIQHICVTTFLIYMYPRHNHDMLEQSRSILTLLNGAIYKGCSLIINLDVSNFVFFSSMILCLLTQNYYLITYLLKVLILLAVNKVDYI